MEVGGFGKCLFGYILVSALLPPTVPLGSEPRKSVDMTRQDQHTIPVSWIESKEGATPMEAVLALRPELLDLYKSFYGKLWDDGLLSPSILELCRLRIAMMHECASEMALRHTGSGVSDEKIAELASWESSTLFDPLEKACLRLAEKMPWQHHEIEDSEVAAVTASLGEPGTVALMVALALFDASARLRVMFEVPAQGEPAHPPPSAEGALH